MKERQNVWKKSRRTGRLSESEGVCVCVSPPVSKGSTSVTKSFECRGIRLPVANLIQRSWVTGREMVEDAQPCTCIMIHLQFLPLFFAFMVVPHDTSHKQVFPQPPFSCRPPLVRCCRESADVHKLFVETPSIDRTHHLAVESFLSLGN